MQVTHHLYNYKFVCWTFGICYVLVLITLANAMVNLPKVYQQHLTAMAAFFSIYYVRCCISNCCCIAIEGFDMIKANDFCKIVKHDDIAVVQLSTRDNAAGDGPDYGNPITIRLFVMKRSRPMKDRGKVHPVGEITELTIQNSGWASYSEEHWSADYAEFVAENYRMKVLALNGIPIEPGKPVIIMDELKKILMQRVNKIGR